MPIEQRILTINWTAGAEGAVADITVDEPFLDPSYGFHLYAMETIPGLGDEAPADEYGIKVSNSNGLDLLGGSGAGREAAAVEMALPAINAGGNPVPVNGPLTIEFTSVTNEGATGTIILYFVK